MEFQDRMLENVESKIEKLSTATTHGNINSIRCTLGSESKPPLVLVHGWGGGLGFWCHSIDTLAERYTVYALDLLGWGLSDRPTFKGRSPQEAQAWWVDSIEEWRVANNIENMTLLGHSLGGYITASYALKYQGRLNRLILVAPAGLLWDVRKEPDVRVPLTHQAFNIIYWNYAQTALRFLGPLSPRLIRNMRAADLQRYGFDDHRVTDYIHHLQVRPKSGESAFAWLMTRKGWAYALYDRVHEIKIPVTFIVGAHDDAVSPILTLEAAGLFNGSESVRAFVLEKGTHQLFADDPVAFHEAVLSGPSDGLDVAQALELVKSIRAQKK